MAVSFRESVHLVADPRNLDASVREVFEMLLGVSCERDPELTIPDCIDTEKVIAVIGFGGLLSGAYLFKSSGPVAMRIASLMAGTNFTEIDSTVKDGIGELANILAGAWKSKVPNLASNCGLSIPAVITGRDYHLHLQAPEFRLHQTFRFEDSGFEVTIVCDGLQ